jgi:hypothetical protein
METTLSSAPFSISVWTAEVEVEDGGYDHGENEPHDEYIQRAPLALRIPFIFENEYGKWQLSDDIGKLRDRGNPPRAGDVG